MAWLYRALTRTLCSSTRQDSAWDDSALINAYETAIANYQRAHGLTAKQAGGKKKSLQTAAPPRREAQPEQAHAQEASVANPGPARQRRAAPDASPSGAQVASEPGA